MSCKCYIDPVDGMMCKECIEKSKQIEEMKMKEQKLEKIKGVLKFHFFNGRDCSKLAERIYEELFPMDWKNCETCKFKGASEDIEPCVSCVNMMRENNWEIRENGHKTDCVCVECEKNRAWTYPR